MSIYRLAIAAVLAVTLVLTMSWLQGRYNESDHRKSLELINSYRAKPNGPTIPEVILKKHPGVKDHEVSWSSEITSGCLGVVRVSAFVPKASATYAFDIRLTDSSIHPADPAAIEILKALTSTSTTP